MLGRLEAEMAKSEGVTEALKRQDWLPTSYYDYHYYTIKNAVCQVLR